MKEGEHTFGVEMYTTVRVVTKGAEFTGRGDRVLISGGGGFGELYTGHS